MLPQLPRRRYLSQPLVIDKANERCGRWYIPLDLYNSSAYFKSTDGHYGHWSFNTRRLNIDFLRTVIQHQGYLLCRERNI